METGAEDGRCAKMVKGFLPALRYGPGRIDRTSFLRIIWMAAETDAEL